MIFNDSSPLLMNELYRFKHCRIFIPSASKAEWGGEGETGSSNSIKC